MRQICNRLSIPLPNAGHWQKIKFGKHVVKKALDLSYFGETEADFREKAIAGENDSADKVVLKQLQKEMEDNPSLSIVVPEKLNSLHKLIIQAKALLTGKDHFYSHNYVGTVSSAKQGLDIRVSKRSVGRALRFMNTFIKNSRSKRPYFNLKKEFHLCSYRCRRNEDLLERKNEKIIKKENERWPTSEYHPRGILYFQLNSYPAKEWKVGKELLELQLPKIMARIELQGQEQLQEQIEARKWRENYEKERRFKEELIERKTTDLKEFEALSFTLEKGCRSSGIHHNYRVLQT